MQQNRIHHAEVFVGAIHESPLRVLFVSFVVK